MRPIRLEVEGFTCYRDRQPPLDFSDLSLFAVAGPTGAGKSSILDAMLYALYGQVPRLGRQGITEVISHGRDALSVCLDFEIQGRRYRVVRRIRRRARGAPQTTATLAEVGDGTERSLADGVRQVNEAIQNVVGLGYEDFTQTVILPQGEFARFLQAEPRGQRAILQNLLRHGVFERMRIAAEERRRHVESRLREIEGRLAMCDDATEEALAAREQDLADAQARRDAARKDRDDGDARLQDVRRCHELTKEVEKLRADRGALQEQERQIESVRAELDNARRAAVIQPRLEALRGATTRAERARREREEAARKAEEAGAALAAAARELEAATAAAQVCDELSMRVRRLDEIAGEIHRRGRLREALQTLPQHLQGAEGELRTARKAEASARKKVEIHEKKLRDLRAAHGALAFDEPLYTALDSVRDDVAHAKSLVRERDAAVAEAEASARDEADAAHNVVAAQAAHDETRERAEAARRALESARAALEEGRNRDRAAALRAHLHAGESCPVCLQTVVEPPALDPLPELKALDAACADAEARAREAEQARQAAAQALATASAHHAQAANAARAAEAKAAERAQALSDAFARLAAAGAGQAPDGAALLAWIEERLGEQRSVKAERDRLDAEMRKVEGELARLQVALANAAAAAAQAAENRDRIVQERGRLESELASVAARIEAVTTDPDPRAERDGIAQRIGELQGAERQAREAHAQANAAARTAEERLKGAGEASREADAHLARTAEAVARALDEAGLASAEAATAAVRTPGQQRALEAQVGDFDRKRAAVLQRLADVEPRIAGREASAAALAEAERQFAGIAARWRDADMAATTIEADCVRLRGAVRTRKELIADRLAQQGRLNITAELATDLRGDRFQEYLLEEAFKALVAGASVRMKTISNRYTLDWDEGEFYVVDHDNAGERRRAETLSGGETFMASLCLALQLSDEVLRTTGALRMDSLFIDEGFGTLDSDSLNEVTDAIEALRHEGGRLIGVISHRPELTERLPGCIRVMKGAGESSWVLERVG